MNTLPQPQPQQLQGMEKEVEQQLDNSESTAVGLCQPLCMQC